MNFLLELFLTLRTIEEGIGNNASVSFRRRDGLLQIAVYWPDGFRLVHSVDSLELDRFNDPLTFVQYLIDKAKDAHPALAPLIS